MNSKSFSWSLRYTLINATYFAAFCTVHAYAAVYLLANGFTNTQVGILLAVANIISAVFVIGPTFLIVSFLIFYIFVNYQID